MHTKQYIGINSPTDFFFVELPTDTKANLPGSSYTFIEMSKFVDRITKKFPGTIRDLAGVIGINPQYLYFLGSKGQINNDRPRPDLLSLIDYRCMVELIKTYYKYCIGSNPKVPSSEVN